MTALSRHTSLCAYQVRKLCLTKSLIEAAPKIILPIRSTCGNLVPYLSLRSIQPNPLRPALNSSDTKIRILGAGDFPYFTEPGPETLNRIEDIAPDRHIDGPQVPNRGSCFRQASIGSADDPIELIRKPFWSSRYPQRFNLTAN